ncbi:MAG: M28 family peptidase [Acidobacteriia bacterium]|nr:M28 family peptidase [Terriglobia bacterium]
MIRKAVLVSALCLAGFATLFYAQEKEDRTLLSWPVIQRIVDEASGDRAMHTLLEIAPYPRHRTKEEYETKFLESATIEKKAKEFGLDGVKVERFSAAGGFGGGAAAGGNQTSNPFAGKTWEGAVGQLWRVEPQPEKLLDYADVPTMLCANSENGDWTAEVVDVGIGARPEDYKDKDVKGKIVLGSANPSTLQRNAVFERGAIGVLSYNSLRPEYDPKESLWESIQAQPPRRPEFAGKTAGFGFKLNAQMGRAIRTLLDRGVKVKLRAVVKADWYPNTLETVFARIPGDGSSDQEIILSAHLYEGYLKQGASDDASGSAAILEVARTLNALISSGQLPRPPRTINFLWVPEISGTTAWLRAHEEIRKKLINDINMDMVGEDLQKNNAFFVLHRTPDTTPNYLNDVMQSVFEFVGNTNRERVRFRANGYAPSYPIRSTIGSDEPFYFAIDKHYGSSDHVIYLNNGIPATQMGVWPDMWYHSSGDTPDKDDPTQFKRAVVLSALGAYIVASADDAGAARIGAESWARGESRQGDALRKSLSYLTDWESDQLPLAYKEAINTVRHQAAIEKQTLESLQVLLPGQRSSEEKLKTIRPLLALTDEREKIAERQVQEFYRFKTRQAPPELAVSEEEQKASRLIPERVGGAGGGAGGGVGALAQLPESERRAYEEAARRVPQHMTAELNIMLTRNADKNDPRKYSVLDIRNFLSGEFDPLSLEDLMTNLKAQENRNLLKFTEKPPEPVPPPARKKGKPKRVGK